MIIPTAERNDALLSSRVLKEVQMESRKCSTSAIELVQTGPGYISWNFRMGFGPVWTSSMMGVAYHLLNLYSPGLLNTFPVDIVDIFGTVVGESPDCLLLSGTLVGENPDHVCWVIMTQVYTLF